MRHVEICGVSAHVWGLRGSTDPAEILVPMWPALAPSTKKNSIVGSSPNSHKWNYVRFLCVINRHACCKPYDATRCCYWRVVDNDAMRRLDGRRYAPKSTTRCRRLDMQSEDTNIGCLLGRLSMIGVDRVAGRFRISKNKSARNARNRTRTATPRRIDSDHAKCNIELVCVFLTDILSCLNSLILYPLLKELCINLYRAVLDTC